MLIKSSAATAGELDRNENGLHVSGRGKGEGVGEEGLTDKTGRDPLAGPLFQYPVSVHVPRHTTL